MINGIIFRHKLIHVYSRYKASFSLRTVLRSLDIQTNDHTGNLERCHWPRTVIFVPKMTILLLLTMTDVRSIGSWTACTRPETNTACLLCRRMTFVLTNQSLSIDAYTGLNTSLSLRVSVTAGDIEVCLSYSMTQDFACSTVYSLDTTCSIAFITRISSAIGYHRYSARCGCKSPRPKFII